LIIDEAQRPPHLLNEVHRFIKENPLRFVLCGPSARKLRRAGVNLIAGRALHRFMNPFVPEEPGEQLNLRVATPDPLLPQGPGLQTEDGIDVFPLPHFASRLAETPVKRTGVSLTLGALKDCR
jgi:hypothetical protein